jgi:homoprotocatechuate degradation regulator HpaR
MMPLPPDPLTDRKPLEFVDENKPRQTQRSLPIALLRARESIMAKFRPMLAHHDINEQQWRVIRVLGEHGELDASQLAERAMVLGPSLTRMIKTLEKSKLVSKRNDRADGRRTILSITAKARSLIKEVTPESAEIYKSIEKKFGKNQTEQLLDLLEALAQVGAD